MARGQRINTSRERGDNLINQPFLFIALDDLAEKEEETLEIAKRLSEIKGNFGFKINLDYLLKHGLKGSVSSVKKVQQFNRPVFADLKMWNGTRTMRAVIKMLVDSEVDYLSVYALADDLLPKAIQATEGSKTQVLGLTVLTHFSEDYCQRHFRRTLKKTVWHLAKVALDRGCHAIILPGTALDVVQDLEVIKVVPGVRPKWYQDKRHLEKVEPGEAIENGAIFLVCGSPITRSSDEVLALKKVLFEMRRKK